ncbi:MAG: fibrillarin-like rRNA/tRNA 2'-O-methyltransferase [Candidatus Thorarchaeota archaeon]|jgi:fibrillarin-like pre-rRNA processing protein|nr:fibrillarin-like rRNA/tRNA 2'-O-methyltransferase [Candidatus Thorarchaeota archaeon]
MEEIEEYKFPGVFKSKQKQKLKLWTQSLVSGKKVYGEKLIQVGDKEYRAWSANRSKLAAAIIKGVRHMPIQPGSRVLYLGAASGTTVSHVSDIVGPNGVVYAVEFSARTARELIALSEERDNIVPIVDDARHPNRYAPFLMGIIDVVYQDIAQVNQARILYENLRKFCSYGAWGMIAVKARSIDAAKDIQSIYKQVVAELDDYGLEVMERVNLEPLEKAHSMVVTRVKEEFV